MNRNLLKDGKALKVQAAGSKSLEGAEDWIAKADLNHYSPAASHAAIIRAGIVSCHANICELVLEP